jgi:hypothetical protein
MAFRRPDRRTAGRGARVDHTGPPGGGAATADIPFGALATLLPAQLNAGNPLGHAIDHLLDHASVGLLQQVIRHDRAKVLLTARPGPSTDLWHDEVVARLPIGALDREQVDDLLTRALDGPVGTWTEQHCCSSSAMRTSPRPRCRSVGRLP